MRRSLLSVSFSHLLAGLAIAASGVLRAQAVDFPEASPAASLKQRVGLTDIEITYSRPGVKGRAIFGALVPYGKIWRTGANSATNISFSTPVEFGGADVPAGTYGLYTLPGATEWTIVLSKRTDLWGAFKYDEKDDLVRVKARPIALAENIETFTIGINNISDESATLQLDWEKTRVPVVIKVDYAAQLMSEIEKTMSGPEANKPYHQAAQFYFDHGHDLARAREWVETATKENPGAYWSLHLQAKILAKLGDKAGAIAAAKKSIALASENGDAGYVKSNNDLLEALR